MDTPSSTVMFSIMWLSKDKLKVDNNGSMAFRIQLEPSHTLDISYDYAGEVRFKYPTCEDYINTSNEIPPRPFLVNLWSEGAMVVGIHHISIKTI